MRKKVTEVMNDRVPLLLFSGGLDSTFLLWETLQTTTCDVLVQEHSFNTPAKQAEQLARTKVYEAIARKAPHQIRSIISHGGSGVFDGPTTLQYNQLLCHLTEALRHVDYRAHSKVLLGLSLTDDSATYHFKIIEVWKSLFDIFKHAPHPEDIVPLELPLMLASRRAIHQATPAWLRKLTWTCAMPNVRKGKFIRCGVCEKCREDQHIERYAYIKEVQERQLQRSLEQVDELSKKG